MVNNSLNQSLEDDSKERVTLMIEHRFPWLVVGLLGGIAATFLASRFEILLENNIQLAFFIPVIVYMADAVGGQTQAVYVRNLGKGKVKFSTYLIKETLLGITFGVVFGALIGLFSYFWFNSISTSLSVSLSLFVTVATAPFVALVVPAFIKKEHRDPAIGSGPFSTVIQDLLSLSIYFVISSTIIFS